MKMIAAITERAVIVRILEHLGARPRSLGCDAPRRAVGALVGEGP